MAITTIDTSYKNGCTICNQEIDIDGEELEQTKIVCEISDDLTMIKKGNYAELYYLKDVLCVVWDALGIYNNKHEKYRLEINIEENK